MTKDNLLEELIQSNYKAKTGTNFNKTIFEIFTSKLCKIYDDKNICWEWNGKKDKKGYGIFCFGGKYFQTHRVSYRIHKKFLTSDLVLHSCDNVSCVNPYHLRLGTAHDNMQDAIQRKRLNPARGEKSGKCKLRDNDVLIILQRHLNGEKQKDIAKDYSVTPKQISMIVRGKQWSHMQQPQWVLKLH